MSYKICFIFATGLTLLTQPSLAQTQFEQNMSNQNTTQTPIATPNSSSNFIPTSSSVYPVGDINQQGGIINNNGISGQQINCGRACVYFYSDFYRNEARFGAGINIPLFGSENEITNAQAKKTLYDVESAYIKAIAEACQSKDRIRAELNAKGLGRIWNVDYKTLLQPTCN